MYLRTTALLIILAAPLNALPWNRRTNYATHAVENSTNTTTTPQLPDAVISSPLPPVLQNATLPTPAAGNSTIPNGDAPPIVVPVNMTSGSADNGDVSQVVSTPDNSSVVVGATPDVPTDQGGRVFRPGTYENAPGVQPKAQAFSFTGPADPLVSLDQPEAQPSFPDTPGCTYEYRSVLGGGNGSAPRGGMWALEDYVWLTAGNVRQGSIGDCGVSLFGLVG